MRPILNNIVIFICLSFAFVFASHVDLLANNIPPKPDPSAATADAEHLVYNGKYASFQYPGTWTLVTERNKLEELMRIQHNRVNGDISDLVLPEFVLYATNDFHISRLHASSLPTLTLAMNRMPHPWNTKITRNNRQQILDSFVDGARANFPGFRFLGGSVSESSNFAIFDLSFNVDAGAVSPGGSSDLHVRQRLCISKQSSTGLQFIFMTPPNTAESIKQERDRIFETLVIK